MKSKQIEILEKLAWGDTTIKKANEELLKLHVVNGRYCGVKDRNGDEIRFGDTLRFADKVEWYRGEYWSKVSFGMMSKKEALGEIDGLPYEERVVEDITDYEWLLSSDTPIYWEIVKWK